MSENEVGAGTSTTPLAELHRDRGARFIPFAGFEMPLQFESIVAEHQAVRERVGIFDVSHMSNLEVPLEQADHLASALGADARELAEGRAKYTVCLREDGTILDDLIVYHLPEGFHVVANAGENEAVGRALAATGCTVTDRTPERCILAVQGPEALALVEETLGGDHTVAPFRVRPLADGGFAAGTGYTGEEGLELVLPIATARKAWEQLVQAGAQPCGLGARDTLRLEKGYALAGNEFDPPVTPVEARLMWTVDLDHVFTGRDGVRARLAAGPERVLSGIRLTDRGVPRRGCRVLAGGQAAGTVSSGSVSPTLGIGIALAYLSPDHAEPGADVAIEVRGRELEGNVEELPFL